MIYFQCFPPGLRNDRLFGTKSTDGPDCPDFLSILLASPSLMRLSLMKAAHADVGGAPWQEIRLPVLIVPRTPLRTRVSFPERQLCYRTEWADRRL
jgi:hypothetical protein